MSPGKDVGAGESHPGEACPVGTPADGDDFRCDSRFPHGLFCQFHHLHDRFYFLFHVEILVPEMNVDSLVTIFCVKLVGDGFEDFFFLPEFYAVVVPDEKLLPGFCDGTREFRQVKESFITFCMFGAFMGRELGSDPVGHQEGIDHFPLGGSGVYAFSPDGNGCQGGVEILIFQFPKFPAVEGKGEVSAEFLYVEAVGAAADLLVGGEAKPDPAVWDIASGNQNFGGGYDFGNSGLVVGPQKGIPSGDNQGLPGVLPDFGELAGAEDPVRIAIQENVAPS